MKTKLTTYKIPARVTLSGAKIYVEARSPEEALELAKKDKWVDVVWDECCDLCHCQPTGDPVAE